MNFFGPTSAIVKPASLQSQSARIPNEQTPSKQGASEQVLVKITSFAK